MSLRSCFGLGLLLGKIGCRSNKQRIDNVINCFLSVSRPLSLGLGLPPTLPRWPQHTFFNNLLYSSVTVASPFNHAILSKFYNQRHLSMRVYTCWRCNNTIGLDKTSLFCNSCDALQRPDLSLNYFDIIGVEQKYEISIDELRTKYHKLQNMLHPDRFSNRDKEEIKISEEYSSLVNKAYNTLQQPLSRGLYMLKLKGILIEETRVQSSPEFLMKMMEKNEEIEESNEEQLKLLYFENQSVLEVLSKKLSDALNSNDVKCAEEVLIQMKYYSSIDSKIKVLKQKRGIGD